MIGDAERMKPNILIVEDEEALVLLLRYNLEAEGYGVETVARGDEADLLLKERSPDLVILDWMLPGLSGIELCRRLRARSETKRLPIIMLTARGEESERVRGLATGADDYIVKPFSVPELSARVRALLRRAAPERLADVLSFGELEVDREKKRAQPRLRNGSDSNRAWRRLRARRSVREDGMNQRIWRSTSLAPHMRHPRVNVEAIPGTTAARGACAAADRRPVNGMRNRGAQ
jgi:DNA-binding response OmpR family regulator